MFVYMVCIQCVCMSFFLCGWLGWYAPNAVRGVCVRSRAGATHARYTLHHCFQMRTTTLEVRSINLCVRTTPKYIIRKGKGREIAWRKMERHNSYYTKKTQDCLLASIRFLIIAPWRIARSLPHHKQAEFPFFYSVADNFIKIIIASRKYTII